MECLYCRGRLVRKRISYTVTRNAYHLILDDIPAWVCEQCGEPMFDEETVDAIQAALRDVDMRLAELQPAPASA